MSLKGFDRYLRRIIKNLCRTSISLNWLVVYAVVYGDQNYLTIKEVVVQNVISESGPLDRLCEGKNTCGDVGDVPVHTAV